MPKPIRAKITGLGTYVPPRVLTNQDLEKMVQTTDQWILERTGIRERHLVDKGIAASDLAVEAVKNLVQSHPVDLQQIDVVDLREQFAAPVREVGTPPEGRRP